MYMIGAYIRKYGDEKLDKISIYAGIASIILILISILWNDIHMYEGLYIMYLAHKGNSVVGLLAAIGIFTVFKNIKISYNPFINTVASTTFAVYLIHNNPIISDWLWNTVVQANNYFSSPFFLLHMISVSLLLFVMCSVLEWLRLKVINYYINH